jgi:hypothetical protein
MENQALNPQPLDREGTFKAKILSWNIYAAKSGAVAVNMDFAIVSQWNGSDWDSWADYAPHHCYGAFYVVKKDGAINTATVKQLVAAVSWDGKLKSILDLPPDVEVQITVKAEDYNNATVHKAAWINPGDHTPTFGASPEVVSNLDARFGSLLRAAASAK